MIVKGNSRGGATSLANHLQKDTNERVSVVEIEGLAASDIQGALKEIMALTTGTHCRDGMYHASISASPGEAELTPEQRARAVEILAEELGLTGQPRIVVEHEKTGESGITRVHQHIVFGRVDEDGKTISDFQNHPAHERAARKIELEFGHQRTPGAWDRDEGQPRPTRTPGHDEYQQAERTGLDPREAQATLTELWRQSDSGQAFVEAAAERGFTVCQGDKCLLVVDAAGEHVRLSRRLPDRAADIAERMSDVRDLLPTLDEARAALALEAPARSSELVENRYQEVGPELGDPEVRLLSASRDDAAWPTGYIDTSDRNASPFGASERGTGGDVFSDEKPSLAGPITEPTASMDKGLGVLAGIAERAAGQALDVAGDIAEGLLGLLVGAGGPSPTPRQVEPQAERPMTQNQPLSRPTPVELFSELARARLTGEELTEVHRQGAERANQKNKDIER